MICLCWEPHPHKCIMWLVKGPTSYAPVVEAAIDIVEKSGGQYHVLVIIADGQVESEAFFLSLSVELLYLSMCIIFFCCEGYKECQYKW